MPTEGEVARAALRTSPTHAIAPCGCECGTSGNAFIIIPCSKECPTYLYVLDESERQQMPVEKVVV